MNSSGTNTIKTERLTLRRFSAFDLPGALVWYRSPELNRYFTARARNSVWDTVKFVFGKLPKYRDKAYYCWAIIYGGRIQGMVQAQPLGKQSDAFSLYYFLNPELHGRGIMTEAVRAVLAELKRQGANTVWAACDCGNLASARVLEKVGMKRTQTVKRNALRYPDGRVSDLIYYKS